MNKHKATRNSYSLIMLINRLTVLAVPILIISIIISFISVVNIKKQNYESIQNTVNLYQKNVSTKLNAVQHFVLWSIVNEPLIENIEKADNPSDQRKAMSALQARVNDSLYATGNEYHYFFYSKQKNMFFNASSLTIPYQNYTRIRDSLVEQVTSGTAIEHNFTWQTLFLNDTIYLYYMVTYLDRTFAVYIDTADLILPLADINPGKNGTLILADQNGSQLFPLTNVQEENTSKAFSFFYSRSVFPGTAYALPFDILLYSDNFSNYGGMLFWQLVVCLTALALAVILCGGMFHMYFKVITPIREFSKNLSDINEQEQLINLQSSSIQELEQASIQFKNLVREIKKLKIRIYEQELEKKKFQITFLQNQIRPHFYLNCLTTISSMAQLGKTKDIQSMVLFTSRYLHYLFQTDKELVRIKYELEHIQAYLDIQAIRYGSVFTYQCNIDSADEDALIPPLLLITFVENAIKHSNDPNNHLQITLSVVRQQTDSQNDLVIDITDSGQGFPESLLEDLSNDSYINQEASAHVGIRNSLKRLKLLYDTNYASRFYNETAGGAHIHIQIPYQTQEMLQ